jgi:hypothetical protein
MILGRGPDMLFDNIVKAPATHGLAFGVEKKLWGFRFASDSKPSS